MKDFLNKEAFVAVVIFTCVTLWIILPGDLRARTLPRVFLISEFHSCYEHPNISYDDHYYYGLEAINPLIVNSIRLVSEHYCSDGHEEHDTTYAFAGSFEQHVGYFICRRPSGGRLLSYRTSKITNLGYYLEEDFSINVNNTDPYFRTWYTYNDEMKLVRTVYKTSSSWYKIEYEVNSLGKRLQGIRYNSTDSLSWTPFSRTRYYYTGNPTGFAADFEKYLCYPPSVNHFATYGMPLYVNNDWEIDSYGVSYWDGDEWSSENIIDFSLIETATGYHYYFDGQWEWKFNGLPTKLGYPNPNFNGALGYKFVYGHTNQADMDDDLVPGTAAISSLFDAYPNPFRKGESVCIKTAIAKGEKGTLSLYNLRGQQIVSYTLGAGTQQTNFNSKNLPSGIYLYQLRTDNYNKTKKLVLLK